MTMHIQDDSDMAKWVEVTLEAVRNLNPPCIDDRCYHCGLSIRFPLVVRKSDLDLFERMIRAAEAVMERHGVTAMLLAEIRAECLIAIAKRK